MNPSVPENLYIQTTLWARHGIYRVPSEVDVFIGLALYSNNKKLMSRLELR